MPSPSRSPEPRPRRLPHPGVRASLIALTLALIIALLAACGQQAPPTLDVELDTSTVELLRGAPETQVQVSLTRTGTATGDVELSITGLPADVTATLTKSVLSGANDTTTLTLVAPAEAVEGVHNVQISATSQGLSANASLQVQVVGLTVTGTFSTMFMGPVSGIAVASQDDTAVTDSDGRFTLRGLSVPYDITAWSVTDRWLHEYRGLSESEVTLSSFYIPGGPPDTRTASITAPLSGNAVPVAVNQMVHVCVEGIYGIVTNCVFVGSGESSFSINTQWFGGTTRSVRLHLLQVEVDADKPVAYLGYASRELDLKDGVPVVFTKPIDLGEALETVTVQVDVEADMPLSHAVAAVRVGPEMTMPVMSLPGDTTSYEVLMPVIPDASYTFLSITNAMESAGWAADVTGTEASVVIPASTTVSAPESGATGVTTDTDFEVSGPGEGPVTWMWSGFGYDVGLTSMERTVNMPDPSEHGFSITPGASSSLTVWASGGSTVKAGARVVNDLTNVFALDAGYGSSEFPASGWITSVTGPSFTTAP